MKRYFIIYGAFIRFAFAKAMHFRFDFFFRVIMDLTFYAIQFSFFHFLFSFTNILGEWNIDQIRIFISGYILIDALHMTFFANNMWHLPFIVNRGELDYYLTKPISSLFFISFKDFAANSFLNLIFALSLLAWTISLYPENLAWYKIFLFIILLINGCYLFYLIHLLFILPIFWTGANRGFADLFFTATKVAERPHHIFSSKVRMIFLTILPFGVMASKPAEILFSDEILYTLLWCLGVTLSFKLLVLFVWKKGLAAYSSASS